MFRFEDPIYLLFLVVIPVLALIRLMGWRQRKKKLRKFGDPDLLKELMPDVSKYRPSVKFWVALAALAMLIFMLSSDDANDSANFTYVFVELINGMAGQQVVDNSTLRVIGHMMEFGCLAFLTFMAFDNTNKISYKTSYAESPMKILQSDNEMNIILTLWFTILNSLFDEYHQMFVSGRDGSIVDVGVDCIGIIIVLLIIRIVFSISLKARGKKEVRYQV